MLARIDTESATAEQVLSILRYASEDLGMRISDYELKKNNSVRFRLRLDNPLAPHRYNKTGYSANYQKRYTGAICWHGFRDFFRQAYKYCAALEFKCGIGVYHWDKSIKTVTYVSPENFEQTYPETDYEVTQAGITRWLSDCCDCDE